MAVVEDDKHASRPRVGEMTPEEEAPVQQDVDHEQTGNAQDRTNMWRMDKKQEFGRNSGIVSIFGFSMILMASWETILSMSYAGLEDGGTAGMIWMLLVCWICFTFVNTSLAEMGSMAPTSGGQHHWISEFAPRQYQRFLSYLVGWLCTLGWQAPAASAAFLCGTQIQGLLVLNHPGSYIAQPWHGTLLTIAVSLVSVVFNTVLARALPLAEGVVLVIHVFAWLGIVATLWAVAPMGDAAAVLTTFADRGWWGGNDAGASTLVGITACILPLIGADAAVHISEEVRDASRAVPLSMMWTSVLNGAMGWVTIITLCFSVATMDLDQVLGSATGYPFMQIFANAVQSSRAATAMVVWIVVMAMFAEISIMATASRQIFAFARDHAVPHSPWFARVSPRWNLPLHAIFFTFCMTTLLALINLGSATALNSITSLATNALLSSYICSVGCMIWRRATRQSLRPAPFRLGRWGLPMNIFSEIFLVFAFVLAFFPLANHPDPANMNWNILIYGFVVVFSLVYYVLYGKKQYVGRVEYVRKLE